MKEFWNERYSEKEYVYGERPNVFFAEELQKIKPGNIILPCEGEGRNAVYASSLGWDVTAFDSSQVAREKSFRLSVSKGVSFNYLIDDAAEIDFLENSVDLVAFIYAHFPDDIRKKVHQKAITWLKSGGKIILEAFNSKQLENNSGGPQDVSMLYTEKMLRDDFRELKIELIENLVTDLQEGKYHEGKADIIRFVATKL